MISQSRDKTKQLAGRLSAYLIMAIVFAWYLFVSWGKWGDCIIDTFREPWLAYKILQGKVLYRDLFYEYGFLPPYCLAFFFILFGSVLRSAVYMGICITAATSIVLYRISRLFLSRFFATFIVLHFLVVFAFFPSIFNYILPYSSASTLCVLAILIGLYCFIKWLRKTNRRYFVGWVIALIAAFLVRIELSFVVWIVFFSVGSMWLWMQGKKKSITYLFLPPLCAALAYAGYVWGTGSGAGFKESLFDFWRVEMSGANKVFTSNLSGFADFKENLTLLGLSTTLHLCALFLFLYAGRLIAYLWQRQLPRAVLYACVTLYAVVIYYFGLFLVMTGCFSIYAFFSAMLVIGIAYCLIRLCTKHDIEHHRESLIALVMFMISFVFIGRIILRPSPLDYGFCLLLPALISYYIFCVKIVPCLRLNRRMPLTPCGRRYFLVAFVVLLIVLQAPFIHTYHMLYQGRNIAVSLPGQNQKMFYFPEKRTYVFWEAVRYVDQCIDANRSLVVLPEGVGVNFLTRRDNPTRYYSFIPSLMRVAGEGHMLTELQKYAPDYVMIVNRFSPEYGAAYFGLDYGKELFQWAMQHYTIEKTFGDEFPLSFDTFWVVVLRKKAES